MCRGDTSLMMFRQDQAHRQLMLTLQGPQHVCSGWDELMLNMAPRVIPQEEMQKLINLLFFEDTVLSFWYDTHNDDVSDNPKANGHRVGHPWHSLSCV